MQKITPSELQKIILMETNVQIVDVRTLGEYIDFRIDNSLLIPLNYINQFATLLKKHRDVYAISNNERRSKEFCSKLDAMGYRTFYLEGGLKAWDAQHFDLVSTLRKPLSIKGLLYIFFSVIRIVKRILLSFKISRIDKQDAYRLLTLSQIHKNRFISVNTNSKPVLNIKMKIGKYPESLSVYFRMIISNIWFYETINVNLKFVSLSKNRYFFENHTLGINEKYLSENFVSSPMPTAMFEKYSYRNILEYGYKVLPKLSIDRVLQEQADKYIKEHLTEDWLGVHYRGTDYLGRKNDEKRLAHRQTYLSHIKEVIPDHCDIYVSSDQAQFIDEMYEMFPSRVFARDIQRSDNKRSLHSNKKYSGVQQQRDALIDILILAKAKLIYRSEMGAFVNITKFLNPDIEIISPCRGLR